jgi:hypothetical protein
LSSCHIAAKSLVFSQYKSTLKWLQQELPRHGYQFRTLSGDMSVAKRSKALRDFQNDPPTFSLPSQHAVSGALYLFWFTILSSLSRFANKHVVAVVVVESFQSGGRGHQLDAGQSRIHHGTVLQSGH